MFSILLYLLLYARDNDPVRGRICDSLPMYGHGHGASTVGKERGYVTGMTTCEFKDGFRLKSMCFFFNKNLLFRIMVHVYLRVSTIFFFRGGIAVHDEYVYVGLSATHR